MFDTDGFNGWAQDFERETDELEAKGGYPFGHRSEILDLVYERAQVAPGDKVCDMGCGTALLLRRFADTGCKAYGIDAAEEMLAIARERLSDAIFLEADARAGMPQEWGSDFKAVCFTYAIHHLSDADKYSLIDSLLGRLSEDGLVLIGDVMFANWDGREECRKHYASSFDEEEYYCIVSELKKHYPQLKYYPVSSYAGVIEIGRA